MNDQNSDNLEQPWSELKLEVIYNSASLAQIAQLSPTSLAYLGDAVYELFVRTHYLFPIRKMSDYHQKVVNQVRAENQAACLKLIEPYLTETEKEIIRRGRNAASGGPKRLDPELYQQASSLETLIGYLYLQNPQRLDQLLQKLLLLFS